MRNKISEFIDTYSDDILYLLDAREALMTHPFRVSMRQLRDASFCRMLAVFMIGNIEHALDYFNKKSGSSILEVYFAKNTSNRQRVQNLLDAFVQARINVEREVFEDYLAIKYLRNTIVHAEWGDKEIEWIRTHDFPTDTRDLDEKHWNRMLKVNNNLVFYIMLAQLPEKAASLKKSASREGILTRVEEYPIFTKKHVSTLYWRTLENIHAQLQRTFEESFPHTVPSREFEAEDDPKMFFYSRLLDAILHNQLDFSNEAQLAETAIRSWNEYYRMTFKDAGITIKDIRTATKVLESLHEAECYLVTPIPFLQNIPDENASILDELLPSEKPLTAQEILTSLRVGAKVYDMMINITPCTLFSISLPIVDLDNKAAYMSIAKICNTIFKLRHYWYDFVEQRKLSPEDPLAFHRRFLSHMRYL